MHAVRNIVAALNRLVQAPSVADPRARAGRGAGPPMPRLRPRAAAGVEDPAQESAYARAGTEPCLDEMLRDPIVELVIRADRLEPADVRDVLDGARRSAALAEPRRSPPPA